MPHAPDDPPTPAHATTDALGRSGPGEPGDGGQGGADGSGHGEPGGPGEGDHPGHDHDPDDLAGASTPLTRLVRHGRRWLAALVAIALVLPAAMWAVDELRFRQSAAGVVETLDGELSGTDAAETVLLVRAAACGTAGQRTGSAFVADLGDGPVVVTNRHVVEDAAQVGIRPLDGASLGVEAVHLSDRADVAVLEVDDPQRLPAALVLQPVRPEVGTSVRLIGFPRAMPFTAEGTVTEVSPSRVLLELDVDPGASGSPVVTDDGRVVGQVFAVTDEGLGVATPGDLLVAAIEDTRPAEPC